MAATAKKISVSVMVALLAMIVAATTALAAVNFDPATGTGFVGKGDVQTAFGWNNKQLQDNATAVSFSYEATDNYAAVCQWTTGKEGSKGYKIHDITLKRSQSISSAVDADPRQVKGQKQFTGFNLNGYAGDPVTSGSAPEVGSACVGNEDGINHNGTWTSVDLVSSSGGLYASHNGISHLLQ